MKRSSMVLGMVLLFFLLPQAASAYGTQLNYAAFGDSLAAGVTPYKELGKSYTDILADKLKGENALAAFSKDFAVPGYTTGDVLRDMERNVGRRGKTIRQTIMQADIITISAGANDMLHAVKVNKADHTLEYDRKTAERSLRAAGDNLVKIQRLIKVLNPDAQIFVMGYYNSFPYLPEDTQPAVNDLLDDLNHNIRRSTVACGTVFVPTREAVGTDNRRYLPNPQNIHLSVPGYLQVAEQFWDKMQGAVLLPAFTLEEWKGAAPEYPNLRAIQRASLNGRSVVAERLIGGGL